MVHILLAKMSARTVVATALVLVASTATAFSRTNSRDEQIGLVRNDSVSGYPQDLTISNDGRWAVLRTITLGPPPHDGWLYVWDLWSPGYPLVFAAGEQHPSFGANTDFVEALDDRILAAASWSTLGTGLAYTRAYQMLSPTGNTMPTRVIDDSTYDAVGDVAVALAPNTMERLGIVRHIQGPVTLWNMDSGTAWNPPALTTPNFTCACVGNCAPGTSISYTVGPQGTTLGCSDALIVTGNRLVVIANGNSPHTYPGNLSKRGMLAISDLVGGPGWPQEHTFTPCLTTPYWPELVHDIAVTPDGTRCVVSGTGVFGYYGLKLGAQLGVLVEDANGLVELPTPFFNVHINDYWTVDSIETTNSRAVLIGNRGHADPANVAATLHTYYPSGANDAAQFEISVIALRSSGITGYVTYTMSAYSADPHSVSLNVIGPSRAADLAITPNGSLAVVHTRKKTVIIDLTAPIDPPPVPTVLSTTADPLDIRTIAAGPVGTIIADSAVLSDSVACTDSRAVVIGQRPNTTGGREGIIEVVNLLSTPPTILASIALATNLVPTDVAISSDGRRAVVRSFSWTTGAGVPGDGQVHIVDLPSGVLAYTTSSSSVLGKARGMDQVHVNQDLAISAGDNASAASPGGWFQIMRIQ